MRRQFLYSVINFTGSKFREAKRGEMRSLLLVLLNTEAPALWTNWKVGFLQYYADWESLGWLTELISVWPLSAIVIVRLTFPQCDIDILCENTQNINQNVINQNTHHVCKGLLNFVPFVIVETIFFFKLCWMRLLVL